MIGDLYTTFFSPPVSHVQKPKQDRYPEFEAQTMDLSVFLDFLETPPISFQHKSQEVVNQLITQIPELSEKIKAFMEKHDDFIKELQNGMTWNQIKSDYHEKRIDFNKIKNWEVFRQEAKKFMEEDVVKTVLHHFGLPEVEWQAIGTPGYNSDIDNTAKLKQSKKNEVGYNELSCTLAKVLFDMGWCGLFGDLSGIQIDLETYISHGGERVTYSKIANSTMDVQNVNPKMVYSQTALFGVFVQLYRGMNTEEWGKWKTQLLEKLKQNEATKEDAVTIEKIFSQVEAFEENTLNAVGKQAFMEEALAKSVLYGTKELEEQWDRLSPKEKEKYMDRERAEYKRALFSYKTAKLMEIGKQMWEMDNLIGNLNEQAIRGMIPREILQSTLETLELKLALLDLLRECFLDEGYISQGAYMDICKRASGQSAARDWEKLMSELKRFGHAKRQTGKELSMDHERFESILENAGMWFHKFHHYQDTKKGLIEASKYEERVTATSEGFLLLQSASEKKVDILNDDSTQHLIQMVRVVRSRTLELYAMKRKDRLLPRTFQKFLAKSLEEDKKIFKKIREDFASHIQSLIPMSTSNADREDFVNNARRILQSILENAYPDRKKEDIHTFVMEFLPSDIAHAFSDYDALRVQLSQKINKEFFDIEPEKTAASVNAIVEDVASREEVKQEILASDIKGVILSRMYKERIFPILSKKIPNEELAELGAFSPAIDFLLDARLGIQTMENADFLKEIFSEAEDYLFQKHELEDRAVPLTLNPENVIDELMTLIVEMCSFCLEKGKFPHPCISESSPVIDFWGQWDQLAA